MTHDEMIAVIHAESEGKTILRRNTFPRGYWFVKGKSEAFNFGLMDYKVEEEPETPMLPPIGFKWGVGTAVRKKSGSWWEGKIVGFYSTEQTPFGYCIQLDKPFGPVQIYPETALELIEVKK